MSKLTSTQQHTKTCNNANKNKLNTQLSLNPQHKSSPHNHNQKKKSKYQPCPEDTEIDRKEATFAMLGMLWSSTAASSSILSTILTAASPNEAKAAFGEDAKIEIPNMMDNMNNRVNQQCLVESLGNRECLVYLDPANKLYKGAEGSVLVERLEKATSALALIPDLVNDKKWSKVQGILTGPMNPLGATMDKLSKLSENEELCCKLEKSIKNDLYAIGSAVERKDGDKVLKLHDKVTKDLVAYANSL